MSALPPHREHFVAADPALRAGARWAVLEGAARTVAELAGLREDDGEGADVGAALNLMHAGAAELACRAIDDLASVMEPGICALLTVRERGQDPAPAAGALWSEFVAARAALIGLAPHA